MIELSQRRQSLLICLALALATAAVYWPVRQFGFVNYDDNIYITENPRLRDGLTLKGFAWAVTTPLDQWMPVTWLARILECQWLGLSASAHHLVNGTRDCGGVIVVDDPSQDETVVLAKTLPHLKVHTHPTNRAYGANQKPITSSPWKRVRILLTILLSWFTPITSTHRS